MNPQGRVHSEGRGPLVLGCPRTSQSNRKRREADRRKNLTKVSAKAKPKAGPKIKGQHLIFLGESAWEGSLILSVPARFRHIESIRKAGATGASVSCVQKTRRDRKLHHANRRCVRQ